METSSSILEMLNGNQITVPNYQRAYSWEDNHVKTFLADLEENIKSKSTTRYYFGHFLFEDTGNIDNYKQYNIIDGQQRLTTIIIFLSALFKQLESLKGNLGETEAQLRENTIKRGQKYVFSTVKYDKHFFQDYVINQNKENSSGETPSQKRIADTFEYFKKELQNKARNTEEYITKMLETVTNALCTTHVIQNKSESIQMFIFQNNRGKHPSRLEILKAYFMHCIHLYAEKDKIDNLIEEIEKRFEKIYTNISKLEKYNVNEDNVLVYAGRIYYENITLNPKDVFDSVMKHNITLGKENTKKDIIEFINKFSLLLEECFDWLVIFFDNNESNMKIHSFITLGGIGIAIPFIIQGYRFGYGEEIGNLCEGFEILLVRDRIAKTKASLITRLRLVFLTFCTKERQVQDVVNYIKGIIDNKDDWKGYWWSYWNDNAIEAKIDYGTEHNLAKFLLWKYEYHLSNKKGYDKDIINFKDKQLEHIAPQHYPTSDSGYWEYNDEWDYIHCFGNYLLISGSHNSSIGNKPFAQKRDSYTHLKQQEEVREMTKDNPIWDKDKIDERHEKIKEFVWEYLNSPFK